MKRKKALTSSDMGKLGGAARAKSLTPDRRKRIAKKAAKARWAKHLLNISNSIESPPLPA